MHYRQHQELKANWIAEGRDPDDLDPVERVKYEYSEANYDRYM